MRAALILLLVLAGGPLGGAWAEEPTPPEPVYEGKTASYWISELDKDDLATRRKAAYAIFKLGPAAKEAAPALARALVDDDDYLRDTIYATLVALGEDARPARVALRSALNDGRERVRRLAMWALLRIDPATAFRDEDFDVRKAAILAVIQVKDLMNEIVFGEIAARVVDEDEEVRMWAARAVGDAYCFSALDRPYLVREKPRLAEPLCRMAAKDEAALTREAGLYGLQCLARYPKGHDLTGAVAPTLLDATRDESPTVRAQAFISLGHVVGKSEEAEKAFLLGLEDPQANVRAAAAAWIASVSEGVPQVVDALIALLDDEDRWARRHAVGALGAFSEKSARAVPSLTDRLSVEKHSGVLADIAKALGDIGPAARPALPHLEGAFAASESPSAEVAYALLRLGTPNRTAALGRLLDVALSGFGGGARAWLGTLGPTAAPGIPRIVEALSKGVTADRIRAAWTLRALGPVAMPAVPALEALLKEDAVIDEEFAAAVRDALQVIRGS